MLQPTNERTGQMRWEDLPDIDYVLLSLKQLSQAKAQLRVLELELQIQQALISKRYPRNTAARIIGVDEESQAILVELQHKIVEAKNILDGCQATVDFNEYRKDAAKVMSYKGRI